MHAAGKCTLAHATSSRQSWYGFAEPSGKTVYGLWNTRYQTFTTFITQDMFEASLGQHAL
ncbi:MAG: hypothetical protein AAF708_11970 [Deinococcota bacterium]